LSRDKRSGEPRPYFGREVTFAEAFPRIADLRVEVDQVDMIWGNPIAPGPRAFTMDHQPGEVVACHDPHCYGGGLQIGELLRGLVRRKETELSTSLRCEGYEASPGGQRRYRSCATRFVVRIHIAFSEEDAAGPADPA